jgi:peptide/nickel transport system substrate-binding protein
MTRRGSLILILFLFLFSFCKPTPKQESGVKIRISQDPETLNPVNFGNTFSLEIVNLIYQSLISTDREQLNFVPLLVEKLPGVEKSDTSSSFHFQLRKEAQWPSGQPVTAEDVVFSLKLLRCPLVINQQLSGRYDFIRDIQMDPLDKKKFTILCDPYTPEMDLMTGDFAILPRHLVDPKNLLQPFSLRDLTLHYDSLGRHADIKAFAEWFNSERFSRDKNFLQGSGGYELQEWKTGQYVQLKKKANWWGDQYATEATALAANPQQITFQIIPENATALLALREQQVDVFPGLPVSVYQQLAADKAFTQHYQLFTPETYDFTYLGINGRLAKFADARTRQALAHLLDVDKIIQTTQSGFALRTVGPVNPRDKRFYNQSLVPYTWDPRKSEALLLAAGWEKQGSGWRKKIKGRWEPLAITLNYKAGNTEFESIALIFQQAAAKINIPVTIQPVEGLLLTSNLKAHNFDMFIRYLSGNPFIFNFKPILHTESGADGGANYTGFGTPESDQLIEQINQTEDMKAKAAELKRFQEVLHEESNLIFLYFMKERLAIHKRFTNLRVSGIKPGYDVSAFTLQAK